MALSSADFAFVSDFARRSAALVLEAGKEYLVETRLAPLAREHAAGSLEGLVQRLRTEVVGGPLRTSAIDALTTHETSFFRDQHPFDALRETVLPDLIARNAAHKTLSIWSAACSTGQEPYSVAMLLREHFPALASWTILILATDVAANTVLQARRGRYSEFDVHRGVSPELLTKYFRRDDTQWEVVPALRDGIDFRERNLIEPWPIDERFDLVLCRNVMIYFDVPTKQEILAKIRQRLNPGGVLLLGGSETTFNIDPAWTMVRVGPTTLYRRDTGTGA
jgi:chemotaxis protein methyltransferase CheR